MPADSGLDQEKAGGEKKRMLQMWLDQNQYSRKGILRYEAIFGRTYVSVGGEETTKDFCSKLCLTPGMKVLDIGCGTGGSAFYMARRYVIYSAQRVGFFNIGSGRVGYWTKYWVAGRVPVG